MEMTINGEPSRGSAIYRSRVGTPKGFSDTGSFLRDMRTKYDFAKSMNDHNERSGRSDAKFVIGEQQWDPVVEQKRKAARKPILTVDRLGAFVAQVIGNRLMNETEIRVYPDKGGTKEIAKIREGIIRSIYKNSMADFARDEAMKYQVIGGQGAFCLSVDYTDDDVFEQDIRIKAITDPYAATFDPLGIEPSGGDCEYGWVEDDIPHSDFKARWPWAADTSFESSGEWNSKGYWLREDTIRVASYWRMVTDGHKVLALFQDGAVHDVTEMEEYEYINMVASRPDGSPYTRVVPNRFAQLYIVSGNDILEGPFNYPISSIPIYRVPGWEVFDGEQMHRWGLVRKLKDSQRLHNYFRSVIAEQLVAAPRNKWTTTPDAVKGHESRWRGAPNSDDPFLFFNDGELPPQRVDPAPLDAALIEQAATTSQDMKDISNIHEANLGMPSNEVSGKAIERRQNVSDIGTFIYHDRLRMADERCAKNINELIPYTHDTMRTLLIMGDDDKPILQKINDPSDPNSDVTLGKYGITVSVGPATVTKRALANEQMMAFVNAIPEKAGEVMDLVAEAQDWPKAKEFARRFALSLPPGILKPEDMTPEQRQMMEQNQQQAQMQAQLEQANAEREIALKAAKSSESVARAEQARAMAYKAISDAQARMLDVQSKNTEREHGAMAGMIKERNDLIEGDRNYDLDRARLMLEERTSREPQGELANAD